MEILFQGRGKQKDIEKGLKSLDRLRGHPLFIFAHLRAVGVSRTEAASGGQVLLLARHASENASGSAGGCPQSVESAVLRAFEDAFNVAGCRFCAFENAFGGAGGCLAHL